MEIIILYVLVFIAGTFIGSFLNVVADRLINGESISHGRSHCESCKKTLEPKNLIPLLSFFAQGGKCSFCNTKLSWYYPVSEIITGIMFVLAFYITDTFSYPLSALGALGLFFLIIMFCIYIILFLADAKYQLVPDVVVFIGVVVTVLFHVFVSALGLYLLYKSMAADQFGVYLLKAGYLKTEIFATVKNLGILFASSIVIALFFYGLVALTKERGMGKGDIGLGLLVGLFNGFPLNILAVFLGFVFGAVVSLLLIVFKRKSLKDTVAFGPFLLFASVFVLFFGQRLLTWYLGLL